MEADRDRHRSHGCRRLRHDRLLVIEKGSLWKKQPTLRVARNGLNARLWALPKRRLLDSRPPGGAERAELSE